MNMKKKLNDENADTVIGMINWIDDGKVSPCGGKGRRVKWINKLKKQSDPITIFDARRLCLVVKNTSTVIAVKTTKCTTKSKI